MVKQGLSAAVLVTACVGALALGVPEIVRAGNSTVYPPPLPSLGGALSDCPSPTGLQQFSAHTEANARANAVRYGRVSLSLDLADSDRSWQPTVRTMWKHHSPNRPAEDWTVRKLTAASRNPYRVIVRRSCGEPLVSRSLAVTVGPPPAPGHRECSACAETMFLIDRSGRALIYYVH